MLVHHLDKHVLIAVELLCGDEHVPVDHLNEVLLQFIQILEGHPTNAGYVVVRKEDVIVEFGCDEHSGKNESVQRGKGGLSSQSSSRGVHFATRVNKKSQTDQDKKYQLDSEIEITFEPLIISKGIPQYISP